jgi:hypothetical protein
MVLLMTMSVASVAMGQAVEEGDVIVRVIQPLHDSSYHIGDSVPMKLIVDQEGQPIISDVIITVVFAGTCVIEPDRYNFNLGSMNVGDSRTLSFGGIAKKEGDCQLIAFPEARFGRDAKSQFQIIKSESVPEFPTVALPAIAVMGLIFLLQRRKAD